MLAARSRGYVILFCLAALCCVPIAAQKMVILVRHAEKDLTVDTADPALSPEGGKRAQLLAEMLKDAGVTAIYVSEYKRTALTAEPLAKHLGVVPKQMPAKDSLKLVATIRNDNASDVVLVAGHSNTVPELLRAFGHEALVKIDDFEYNNLFFVIPQGEGKKPLVLRLHFGAPMDAH